MGLGGISIWQLLIILAIVVLVFGTARLKNMGRDVGGAIKSFRKAMDDESLEPPKLSNDSERKQAERKADHTHDDVA